MDLGVMLPWSTKATSPFDVVALPSLSRQDGTLLKVLQSFRSSFHFKDNSSTCIQLTRTRDQEERSPRVRTSFPIVQTL